MLSISNLLWKLSEIMSRSEMFWWYLYLVKSFITFDWIAVRYGYAHHWIFSEKIAANVNSLLVFHFCCVSLFLSCLISWLFFLNFFSPLFRSYLLFFLLSCLRFIAHLRFHIVEKKTWLCHFARNLLRLTIPPSWFFDYRHVSNPIPSIKRTNHRTNAMNRACGRCCV